MNQNRKAHHVFVACVFLVLVTVAAYWQVGQCEFVNVDDPGYVAANDKVQPGLSWAGVHYAFTSDFLGNWHPLTWLSHMVAIQLFGAKPTAHHLINLALHVANALLLFAFLLRITGALGRSAAVACLFALHPLHVESVAWVSERKDVLSAFFFFLTLLAYARYAQRRSKVGTSCVSSAALVGTSCVSSGGAAAQPYPGMGPTRPSSVAVLRRVDSATLDYLLALFFFALGLMSKPMLVTLPFVLLLLDYWPLKRIALPVDRAQRARLGRLALEKAPLLALSAIFCSVTFLIQSRSGAISPASLFPLDLRVKNAIVSYVAYLEKAVWPANLTFFYPYPGSVPAETVFWAIMVLLGITLLVLKFWRQRPYLAIGWLWYLGMLVPVIGLVKMGSGAMADRYMYLPAVGLYIALVWAVADWTGAHAAGRIAVLGGSLLLVPVLVVVTQRQVLFWRNTEALTRHAIAVTTDNVPAQLCLGGGLLEQRKFEEAVAHFREAARILPDYAMTWRHLGETYLRQGKTEAALDALETAQRLSPDDPVTCFFLAEACRMANQSRRAIEWYRRSLSLEKKQPLALNNLAWILATHPDPALRNGAEAVQLAKEACEISRYQMAIYMGTLGAAYAETGQFDLAAATAEKARQRALEKGNQQVAARNEELLKLYRSGRAYHETPGEPAGTAPPVP